MEGSRELYQRKNRLVLRSVGWIGSFLLAQDAGGKMHPTAWASQCQAAEGFSPIATGSSTWGAQLGSALWGKSEWEGT